MTRRGAGTVIAALILGAATLEAQNSAGLRAARAHMDNLVYDSAIVVAERALEAPGLSGADRIGLYELLGYAYASIDSSRKAVEAFRSLILLAPDREPDPLRVSPKITAQYQVALGRELVARRIRVDSASFVAGEGSAAIRFQVSRAAVVRTRVVGAITVVVDSQSTAGAVAVRWNGLSAAGTPAPPGRYQVIVELTAGTQAGSFGTGLIVSHAPLDTLDHLTALPGYTEQAETELAPRSWAPLGRAASYFGIGLVSVLVLGNPDLVTAVPAGLVAVGTVSLALGLVRSLRAPPLRPVPSAVLYNSLLHDQLARRNEEIAAQNAARRLRVVVTVVQVERGP
jgi:hypothetical protein